MSEKENKGLKKLKRAVIKEELVALTGDYKKAITLNQMIYWSERVKDFDKFLEDEKERGQMAMGKSEIEYAQKLDEVDLMSHGWIYKSAEELSEETIMNVSKSTMGTYLKYLCENGWLDKRKNPNWKGDNTFQYRVNLIKIQKDLHKLGYSLEGYPILIEEFENKTPESNNRTSEFENETSSSEIEQTVLKSNRQFENQTTLPDITSEITPETTGKHFNNSSSSNIDNQEIKRKNIMDDDEDLKKMLYDAVDVVGQKNNFKSHQIYGIFESICKADHLEMFSVKDIQNTFSIVKENWLANKVTYLPAYFVTVLRDVIDKRDLSEAERKYREKVKAESPSIPFYNWLDPDNDDADRLRGKKSW